MSEIRIYYESIEQAYHYILPLVANAAALKSRVLLVRKPGSARHLPKGAISAIYLLTTPDILITGIVDEIEYPLILLEFTESVSTEDHELQRMYGALAAYLSKCYYIKVSGKKESGRQHGGADYNPYSTPRILLDKLDYEGYVIAEWETEQGRQTCLQRDQNCPGCPPRIQILDDTVQAAVAAFCGGANDWYDNSLALLKLSPAYKSYRKIIEKASSYSELLNVWRQRESNNSNPDKLRFFVREKSIAAKINRFSHAMDPDRGILTFLSFVFSASHEIYGIYALVRQKSLRGSINSLALLKKRFRAALVIDNVAGGSIPSWLQCELLAAVHQATSLRQEINIQHIWESNFSRILENKVVMTLAFLLDGISLNHNGIKLVWDRRKLLGNSNSDPLDLFKALLEFGKFSAPTNAMEVSNDVTEDEVTYAIVHRVLLPNGFKIISISYPGSQGSGAILPDRQKGRSQPREYPDVIAIAPEELGNIDVLLNESKGMFIQREVEGAAAKLQQYKSEAKYRQALSELLISVQAVDGSATVRNILIGVAFGSDQHSSTTWNPSNVEFIFRIVERENWSIGLFNQSLRDLIPTISGKTNLPAIFQILTVSSGDENQGNLFTG